MSYYVQVSAKQADDTFEKSDVTESTAYKVVDSGVIQLIEYNYENSRWEVTEEISPQGWTSVRGTRYVGTTDSLRGSDSSVANGVRSN